MTKIEPSGKGVARAIDYLLSLFDGDYDAVLAAIEKHRKKQELLRRLLAPEAPKLGD